MKYIITSLSLLVFITIALLKKGKNTFLNPEKLLAGNWQEDKWNYEKVDDSEGFNFSSEQIKEISSSNLIIHEAEQWRFGKNGTLCLKGQSGEEEVSWTLKGRGNILQLKHNNNKLENYEIVKLSEEELTLNFESDIQVRGVAQLTFKRK